jgi:NitT/TauT family transport system substrate-binding protein
MRMLRRSTFFLLGVWVLGLVGCGSREKTSLESFTVAIAYIPNMQFAPFYVALDQGYFSEEGLDLIIDYGFSADVMGLVAGGMADVALADADQLLIAQEVLPVSAFFQYYRMLPMALLTTQASLFSSGDLTGKIIGVSELFGSSYLALRAFMQENALNDIKIERIGYTQLMSLERGLVDAVVVYANNEPIILQNAGINFTLWEAIKSPIAGSVLVSLQDLSARDLIKLEGFARALQRGMQFTMVHPEVAAQISMNYIDGSKFDLILQGIQATIPYFSTDNIVDITMLNSTQQLLQELGLLPAQVNSPSVLGVL